MHVSHLSLTNFRNIARAELLLTPGITVFRGANAQGKTSLLESIRLLATAASHRTSRELELIRWGTDCAQVDGIIERSLRGPIELTVRLLSQGKRCSIADRNARLTREFVGHLVVVLFAVEDLELVKGRPASRRRFLNLELGQTTIRYLDDLSRYRRALRQRNAILRASTGSSGRASELQPWTEALALYGANLTADRAEFLDSLSARAQEVQRILGGAEEELELRYRSSVQSDARSSAATAQAELERLLGEHMAEDLARGSTSVGPHRDDFEVLIGGRSAKKYASQGQQRTAVLSLRLAETQLLAERLGEQPVLMLDDVMSELDQRRAEAVLECTGPVRQILVTTTDWLPRLRADHWRQFEVVAGRVEEMAS